MSEYLNSTEAGSNKSLGVAAHADRRASARFALLIRPAKLVCGPYEYPCVMRDVSEDGVSIRLFHPVPEQGGYEIEMLGGDRIPVERVWTDGLAVGFRFSRPVDLDQILANAGPYPNRPVRLAMEIPAVVEHGPVKSQVTLTNLSQQGARLCTHDFLALGQLVILQGENLPRIYAKVRWRKNDQYGLVFEETFKLGELSALAVRIHNSEAFARRTNSTAA